MKNVFLHIVITDGIYILFQIGITVPATIRLMITNVIEPNTISLSLVNHNYPTLDQMNVHIAAKDITFERDIF